MTPGRKSNLDQLFLMNLWYMHFPIFCFFDSDVSALLQSSVCICSSYWIISTEEVRLRVWSPSKGKEERWRARLVEVSQKGPARSLKVFRMKSGVRELLCPPGRGRPYPGHSCVLQEGACPSIPATPSR